MRKNPWQSTSIALVLFVACVLGCTRSSADAPKNESAGSENKTSANKTAPATPVEIAGNYDVVGTNENGSPYKGLLEIIKHGDVYQFRWNAGKQYDGIGVPNGNVVAVAFTGGANGKGCGVVNYEQLSDGTLEGKWGYWGVNESGTETAARTSGSGLAGNYNATGKNPDGSSYKGTLAVEPSGGGYRFNWSNSAAGFGIQRGTNVSVGIGGSRCAFVAYEIKADGTLDGVWGGYGSTKTGTELATKR